MYERMTNRRKEGRLKGQNPLFKSVVDKLVHLLPLPISPKEDSKVIPFAVWDFGNGVLKVILFQFDRAYTA